jgi:hypothetical protein
MLPVAKILYLVRVFGLDPPDGIEVLARVIVVTSQNLSASLTHFVDQWIRSRYTLG